MASVIGRRHVRKAAYPNGNGVSPQAVPRVEIGRSGLRQFYGRIDEEFLPELKWDKALKVYREMSDNDPTVGSLLNAIILMLRQIEWRFESDADEDEREEFLTQCKDDMEHPWSDLIAEVGRGVLVYGWQVHECVYKLRDEQNSQYPDGKIGWKKLPIRAQDTLLRWDYTDAQELRAMVQRPAPDFKERRLPMDKILLFRSESFKDNPEGRSILRNAYRPWYFKRNIENIEGVGIERDLAGFPVVYIAPQAYDDDTIKSAYETLVTAIKRDEQEGCVLPAVFDEHGNKLYELTLLSAPGERQIDTGAVIERYARMMLQLMLADFIQVGHSEQGSRALATTKRNFFEVAINVFADQIAEVFNRHAIPRLLELNGMETEDAPKLVHKDVEQKDLTALADYLTKLSAAGMPVFPFPKLEAVLMEMAGLPVPTPEEAEERDVAIEEQQQAELENQMAMAEAGKPAPKPAEDKKPEPAEKIHKDEAGGRWVTINGTPVFIEDGQSPDEAVAERFRDDKDNTTSGRLSFRSDADGEVFRHPSPNVDLVGHIYPGSPPQIEVFYYRVPGSEDAANVPGALRGQAGAAFRDTLRDLAARGHRQVVVVDPSADMKAFLQRAENKGWIRPAGRRAPRGRGDVHQPKYDILLEKAGKPKPTGEKPAPKDKESV